MLDSSQAALLCLSFAKAYVMGGRECLVTDIAKSTYGKAYLRPVQSCLTIVQSCLTI